MGVNIEEVRSALENDLVQGNWKKGTFDLIVANAPEWLRQMADELEQLRAENAELMRKLAQAQEVALMDNDEVDAMVSATGESDA